MAFPKRSRNSIRKSTANRAMYKSSFATYSPITKGDYKGHYMVKAFNINSKRGMFVATVKPYKGTKQGATKPSKSGKTYVRYMCEVLNVKTLGVHRCPVLMNVETKHIKIKDLFMTISPNGQGKLRSGKLVKGFFGTINP